MQPFPCPSDCGIQGTVMNRFLTIATVAASAALCGGAWASPCDERFPGTCRVEVSTTTVKTQGETPEASSGKRAGRKGRAEARSVKAGSAKAERRKKAAEIRKARRATAKSQHARRGRAVHDDAPPLPRARPAEETFNLEDGTEAGVETSTSSAGDAARSAIETTGSISVEKPHLVVDESFNLLSAGEAGDNSLESALISRRDQMVGSAPRDLRQ
jgi:hypothetical protein